MQIHVEIDKNITQTGTVVGEFTILSSRVLYVAGSPSHGIIEDLGIVDNFRGCLKQVNVVGVLYNRLRKRRYQTNGFLIQIFCCAIIIIIENMKDYAKLISSIDKFKRFY